MVGWSSSFRHEGQMVVGRFLAAAFWVASSACSRIAALEMVGESPPEGGPGAGMATESPGGGKMADSPGGGRRVVESPGGG